MVPPKKKIHDGESSRKDKSDPNIKIDVDWRKLFETKIEEQIEDVCWAVSFAAIIEARYNKSMDEVKNRLSLSSHCMINNLIKKDDERTMPPLSKVHKFLGDKGLCTTDICPFEGKLPRNIKKLPKGDRVFTYEPEVIETIKEDDIMRVVAKHGPVMGILDTCRAFQAIGKEIYRGPTNGPLQRHSVCIIGYGTMEGTDFWMIRNSWGVNWGENGYGKIIQKSRSGGRSLFQTIWYPKIVELGESSND